MRRKKIEVKKVEIHRAEFVVNVPKFTHKELDEFVAKNVAAMDETKQWILTRILNGCYRGEGPFIVCFRSPVDFGLKNKSFWRVCDFNEALLGETLSPWNVVALCYALNQLSRTGPHSNLRNCCGSSYHVRSQHEEAGRYTCALQITSDWKKPILALEHWSPGEIYFNPTSFYGVKLKE